MTGPKPTSGFKPMLSPAHFIGVILPGVFATALILPLIPESWSQFFFGVPSNEPLMYLSFVAGVWIVGEAAQLVAFPVMMIIGLVVGFASGVRHPERYKIADGLAGEDLLDARADQKVRFLLQVPFCHAHLTRYLMVSLAPYMRRHSPDAPLLVKRAIERLGDCQSVRQQHNRMQFVGGAGGALLLLTIAYSIAALYGYQLNITVPVAIASGVLAMVFLASVVALFREFRTSLVLEAYFSLMSTDAEFRSSVANVNEIVFQPKAREAPGVATESGDLTEHQSESFAEVQSSPRASVGSAGKGMPNCVGKTQFI